MSTKVCKNCGAELSSDAKVCVKCGKDQRNFFAKHKVLSFLILVVIIGVVATSTGGENTTTSTDGSSTNTNFIQTPKQEKFTLMSDTKTTDVLGTTYIEGEIKNNTDKTYSYVQVTFNLYDANGAQLGTALDNINNLEANGTWKYKAIGLVSDEVVSYKLVEITGW